jgi:YidC/Oxa1 family membrane protein insertase
VDPVQLWNVVVIGSLMNALRWLNDLLFQAGLNGDLFSSWSLTIIVFTVIIKLITLPLTLTQLRSSKAMTAVQPKMQALQKQYGKDREKLMQEQMKLYKEHNVNPLAGCLPMLVQMPIWIGLYSALFNLSGDPSFAGGSHFLWIANLSLPEPNNLSWPPTWPLHVPFLPILVGATQFVVQKMMTMPTTDPQQKSMQSMMQFMPIMFVFFTLSVPAGLAVYWLTSNIFSMVQQYFITGWGTLIPQKAVAAVSDKADGKKSTSGSGEASTTALAQRPEPNGHADSATAVRESVMQTPPAGRKRRRRSR